jgi:hypothetical protein
MELILSLPKGHIPISVGKDMHLKCLKHRNGIPQRYPR